LLRKWRIPAGPATAAEVTADGNYVLLGTDTGTVLCWKVSTGVTTSRLVEHKNTITAISCCCSGRLAVTASADHRLIVWDVQAGRPIRILSGHTEAIQAANVSSAASRIVSGGKDHTIREWDPLFGRVSDAVRGREHTGRITAIALWPGSKRAVSASVDGTIRMWDVEKVECQQMFDGTDGEVLCLAPLFGHDAVVFGGVARQLGVWQYTRTNNTTFGGVFIIKQGHLGPIHAVAVSHDGRLAVSGSQDSSIRLWDLGDGEVYSHCLLGQESGSVLAVALTPDERFVIAAGRGNSVGHPGFLSLWKVDTCTRIAMQNGASGVLFGSVSTLALVPDGTICITGSHDGHLRFWDSQTLAAIRTVKAHEGAITAISVSLDGCLLLSAGEDRVVHVWDIESFAHLSTYVADTTITALSSVATDGRFACGTEDGEVRFLVLRNHRHGIPITTAFRKWNLYEKRFNDGVIVVCPTCGAQNEIDDDLVDQLSKGAGDTGPHKGTNDVRCVDQKCQQVFRLVPVISQSSTNFPKPNVVAGMKLSDYTAGKSKFDAARLGAFLVALVALSLIGWRVGGFVHWTLALALAVASPLCLVVVAIRRTLYAKGRPSKRRYFSKTPKPPW
jgi:WD40 repeat protein